MKKRRRIRKTFSLLGDVETGASFHIPEGQLQ
jgi:hypothetical protein